MDPSLVGEIDLMLVGGAVFATVVFVLIEKMDAILDRVVPMEDPLEQVDGVDPIDDA
jgi:hypothetical protein